VFSIACSLFAFKKRSPLFVFIRLQPLLQKHPGGRYPFAPAFYLSSAQNMRRSSATWTCLPHPTIIAARSTVQVHG
jgi:hypothetical protein